MIDLLDIRIWIGKKLYGRLGPESIRIGPRSLIKGPSYQCEQEALEYVAKHTSIPVPKLYKTYGKSSGLYLKLEYIHGTTLLEAWGGLTKEQKTHVLNQSKDCLEQLWTLKPHRAGTVASALGNACFDPRVGSEFPAFDCNDAFHYYLRRGANLEHLAEQYPASGLHCHGKAYETRFTDGDFMPRNIIIRDGKLAAIIDWQSAGWYPQYWEWTKAHYNPVLLPNWHQHLERAMPAYPEELKCERFLWTRLDLPGLTLSSLDNDDNQIVTPPALDYHTSIAQQSQG